MQHFHSNAQLLCTHCHVLLLLPLCIRPCHEQVPLVESDTWPCSNWCVIRSSHPSSSVLTFNPHVQVQFLIGLSAGIYNIVTGCDFDQRVIWSSIVYLISHIFLFSNFYMHSYVKRNGGKGSKRHENGANFLKKDSWFVLPLHVYRLCIIIIMRLLRVKSIGCACAE